MENGEWRSARARRLIPERGLFTTLASSPRGRALAEVEIRPRRHRTGRGKVSKYEARRQSAKPRQIVGWGRVVPLRAEIFLAHAFLHPSELTDTGSEGVPNAMVEAMAAGLLIVATTHGGIP
ncbi:MAG: glycosyltransferase [Akkermansiaceae bacterium]|nr:glycosyltransferase [Akkermansiaceae bacterium]